MLSIEKQSSRSPETPMYTQAKPAEDSAQRPRLAPRPTPPELVMCDLNMPPGDGFQFMETLGARGFKGAVVLMSGMNLRTMHSATLMARFQRLKVVGSLGKPLSASALGAVLANLA